MTSIAKRFKIDVRKIKRLANAQADDASVILAKYKPQKRYKKLHERAQKRIKDLIINAQVPIQISDIKDSLYREMRLKVSHVTL